MFTLFDNIGGETLDTEYKEFSLKVDPLNYYSESEMEGILKTGRLDNVFNKMVVENLQNFIKYVPKYVSSFANSKECKAGKLFFGISDSGEVTGIPFLGFLNKKFIKKELKKVLKKNVITTYKTKNYIMENIDFHIHKVNINPYIVSCNLKEKLNKKQEKYLYSKQIHEEYIQKWNTWYMELSKYSTKLKDLFENKETFVQLVEHIKEKDESKLFVLSQYEELDEMIENITRYKNSNDKLVYWLCSFRDRYLDEIVSRKPPKPRIPLKKFSFLGEFTKLDNLRKIFIENNPEINYFVIEINLLSNLQDEVFYMDKSKTVKKRVRIERDGEPISI